MGKSEAKVREQCSLGATTHFSRRVSLDSFLTFLYSSPGACSLPSAILGAFSPTYYTTHLSSNKKFGFFMELVQFMVICVNF